MSLTETAVDRQISFPLSNVLHANGERNGQSVLHDFTEDIQFMDVEETSGTARWSSYQRQLDLMLELIIVHSYL